MCNKDSSLKYDALYAKTIYKNPCNYIVWISILLWTKDML